MTKQLILDQLNINYSILPIDSGSLTNEVEKYRGGSRIRLFLNDLIEKRISLKSQVSIVTVPNAYGLVPVTSAVSL